MYHSSAPRQSSPLSSLLPHGPWQDSPLPVRSSDRGLQLARHSLGLQGWLFYGSKINGPQNINLSNTIQYWNYNFQWCGPFWDILELFSCGSFSKLDTLDQLDTSRFLPALHKAGACPSRSLPRHVIAKDGTFNSFASFSKAADHWFPRGNDELHKTQVAFLPFSSPIAPSSSHS